VFSEHKQIKEEIKALLKPYKAVPYVIPLVSVTSLFTSEFC